MSTRRWPNSRRGPILDQPYARQVLSRVHLWMAAVTGARRGETCALRWHRVDLEHGVITVAKNYVVVDSGTTLASPPGYAPGR